MRLRKYLLGWVMAGLVCSGAAASAQDGNNVLVAVELTSPTSERIAAHYVQARRIPAENVVALRTGATDEVTRAQYDEQIEGPIADLDQAPRDAGSYLLHCPHQGHTAEDQRLSWQRRHHSQRRFRADSSVSEARRHACPNRRTSAKPIFTDLWPATACFAGPFSHADQDIYLVSRLDGFSEADVIALIDRGSAAISAGDFVLGLQGAKASKNAKLSRYS